MEERTIQLTIVKSESTMPFRSAGGTGPMRNGVDYFITLEDGTLWKETTGPYTDKAILHQLIQDGKVWILKQHMQEQGAKC